jgi:hypothetical protein
MPAPTLLALFALVAGFILGSLSATAFWWLLAFRTMHPHDELSDLERYAQRADGLE